jgi:hypothetical protein
MGSGDPPGLQNRRAAGFLSPVCSTHTRFRQNKGFSSARDPFVIRFFNSQACHFRGSASHFIRHHIAVGVHRWNSSTVRPRGLLVRFDAPLIVTSSIGLRCVGTSPRRIGLGWMTPNRTAPAVQFIQQ